MGSPSSPLTNASQGFAKNVAAVSSSSGTATFTFRSPPQGFTWTGTLSCASAPVGAVFLASIGADSWGDWGGNSVFGPIQCNAQGQLVVSATGLAASTTYVMAWVGSSDPSDYVASIWPDTNSTALTAQVTITPTAVIYFNDTASYVSTGGTGTKTTSKTFTPGVTVNSVNIQLAGFGGSGGLVPSNGFAVGGTGGSTGYVFLAPTMANDAYLSTGGPFQTSFEVFSSIESLLITYYFYENADSATTYTWSEDVIGSSNPYPGPNPMPVINEVMADGSTVPLQVTDGVYPASYLVLGNVFAGGSTSLTARYTSYGFQINIGAPVVGSTYTVQVTTNFGGMTKTILSRGAVNYLPLYFPLRINKGEVLNVVSSSSSGVLPTAYALPSTAPVTTVDNLPGQNLQTSNQGGFLRFSVNVATLGTGTLLAAITATHQAYKIHSFALGTLQTGTVGMQVICGGTDTMAFLGVNNPVQIMNGVITQNALTLSNTSAASLRITVFYEIVAYPGTELYDSGF